MNVLFAILTLFLSPFALCGYAAWRLAVWPRGKHPTLRARRRRAT